MDKIKIFTLTFIFIFSIFLARAVAEETFSWQDCVREAANNHPDLISAQEEIKQSEAAREITASRRLPQIDSNLEISRTKTSAAASKAFAYGVTAEQLLFDGFRTSDNIKAASENITAARYNYSFVSSEVRLRLRIAFINLLKAQELLNISEEIRKIRRGDLGLITLRHESGMEHKGALLTAEANLSQAEFEISQNKRALEVAQRELNKEIGRLQFSPLRVKGDFKVSEPVLEKPDFEALAGKNPSLGKLTARRNAASFGVKAAKANFSPQISAQGWANKNSSHWPPENEQWNAGLAVSLPLFEGGLKQAELAQAKALFKQAQADERSIKDGIVVALEQTWAAFQDAAGTVQVEEKFLNAAEERAKIAEAQYSLGLIQFDTWTIIEDTLVKAKKSFLDARANALLAEADWIQAKGETLEYAQK